MTTETMEQFLARGGSIEKSTSKKSLSDLLKEEGILNKTQANKVAKDLNETLMTSIDQGMAQKQ